MRILLTLLLIVIVLLIAAFAFNLVNIDQTRRGKLPSIELKSGQTPAFNVSTGQITVGSRATTVEVPRVETTRKTIEVPTANVTEAP